MKARLPLFKPGDVTEDVWSGDIVNECEFIRYLDHGMMLFYSRTTKCFVRAFWETWDDEDGEKPEVILNGWECAESPSKFIRQADKRFPS